MVEIVSNHLFELHQVQLCEYHEHSAQSLKLDKMTWLFFFEQIKWQDLALHRYSAVIEYIIFYNLKKWKTILGPHQPSYKLPNPPTRATPNIYPLKLIYFFLYKFLLYQLLLTIRPINNLILHQLIYILVILIY